MEKEILQNLLERMIGGLEKKNLEKIYWEKGWREILEREIKLFWGGYNLEMRKKISL